MKPINPPAKEITRKSKTAILLVAGWRAE